MIVRFERAAARSSLLLLAVALFSLFVLGIQLGFLLSFREVEARHQESRESLERTATWKP